jgi:hypothetical protein
MRIRSLIRESFRELFYSTADVLIAPARNGIAGKVSDPLDGKFPAQARPARGLQGLIPAANLAGLPALCLPCGFASNMPVAVQLVSRPFNENTLLAFGKQYQSQTDWHKRRPRFRLSPERYTGRGSSWSASGSLRIVLDAPGFLIPVQRATQRYEILAKCTNTQDIAPSSISAFTFSRLRSRTLVMKFSK